AAITVDTTAPAAPAFSLAPDSGPSNTDGVTNVGTVNVSGLEAGATWQFSTNGGSTFTTGTGTSFTLAPGTYATGAVQVKQTDVTAEERRAGNGARASTLETSAPAAPGFSL